MTRSTSILTLTLCVAAQGILGCSSSEQDSIASPHEPAPVVREVALEQDASPWMIRSGAAYAAGQDTGTDLEGEFVAGNSAPFVAAAVPIEVQFSGLYTAIATTGMISLAWDAPTTNADGSGPLLDLVGYTVSYGPTSSNLGTSMNVGNVTSVQLELPIGTHFVAVRALDTWDNISEFSNVIQVTVSGPS